jgi:hypothetical protein
MHEDIRASLQGAIERGPRGPNRVLAALDQLATGQCVFNPVVSDGG